jgi:hypothetical protein
VGEINVFSSSGMFKHISYFLSIHMLALRERDISILNSSKTTRMGHKQKNAWIKKLKTFLLFFLHKPLSE